MVGHLRQRLHLIGRRPGDFGVPSAASPADAAVSRRWSGRALRLAEVIGNVQIALDRRIASGQLALMSTSRADTGTAS